MQFHTDERQKKKVVKNEQRYDRGVATLGRNFLDLRDQRLELVEISTQNLADLGALVVGLEGGHGTDTGIGTDLTEIVDINLDECDILVFLGKGLELGGNDLAGSNINGLQNDQAKKVSPPV